MTVIVFVREQVTARGVFGNCGLELGEVTLEVVAAVGVFLCDLFSNALR